TGHVSGSIRHLSILQGPVFLLNSWLNHFTATHRIGHALSRSYSVNLPSSFSTAHPSALEFSSRLPVSVCDTGCYTRFSWKSFYHFASSADSTQAYISVSTQRPRLSVPFIV